MKIEAIDLFCGVGGLSYGLQKAGISVCAGIDFDSKCEYPFVKNIDGAKFFLEDITKTIGMNLAGLYSGEAIKLLAGCAPCQPFSTLRNGTDRTQSGKWPLLNEFTRLINEIEPDMVTMENVPLLKKDIVFDKFLKNLKQNGYQISYRVVDAADYGVPQRRKRLVLLASTQGPIRLLSPEEIGVTKKTVRDAIANLPVLRAGQTCESDPLHKSKDISSLNLERIAASKPGGTWNDWPEHLKLECHKKESGSTFKSVYGRLKWDAPSGTITTQSTNIGTGRFGHPAQNRGLSLREMAILQSFPREYKFVKSDAEVSFTSLGRLIGNAVPVDLGFAVGKSIQHHIHGSR